jgi:hypothetical protein
MAQAATRIDTRSERVRKALYIYTVIITETNIISTSIMRVGKVQRMIV